MPLTTETLDPATSHGLAGLLGGFLATLFVRWLLGRTFKEYEGLLTEAIRKDDLARHEQHEKEIASGFHEQIKKLELTVAKQTALMQTMTAQFAYLNGQLQGKGIISGPIEPKNPTNTGGV